MKYRIFGRTGWSVSEVAMHLGAFREKTWWGTTDDQRSIRALRQSFALALTFSIPAYVYGDGHSEKILARALGRKEVYVATKIPREKRTVARSSQNHVSEVFPREWIGPVQKEVSKQLKRTPLISPNSTCGPDAWLNQAIGWGDCTAEAEGKIGALWMFHQ